MSEQINDIVETEDDGVSETRQRILDAALTIFIEQGYKGATTRRIAQEADVNEVTIFRHFGNKLKLMAAVLDNASGIAKFEQMIAEDLTGDIHTDLPFLIKQLVHGMRKSKQTMHLFMCEVHRIPELHEIMHQQMEYREQIFQDLFKQWIDAGVLRSDIDHVMMANVFRGVVFSYGRFNRSQDETDASLDEKVAQLADILLNGSLSKS